MVKVNMQMKSKCLSVILANVMQIKFEHLIHMKAKSKRLIYRKRRQRPSLNT